MERVTSSEGHHEANEAFQLSFEELVAGGVAGFAEHFVMFPCDTIKTRMQGGRWHSIRHVLRHVWHQERLTNLYRGCVPTLVSAVPAHGAYFSVYEAFKRLLGGTTNYSIVAAASFATVAHDTVSTPFDVVKQRMQMDKQRTYSSSLDCAKRIIHSEGVPALFRSLPTTIIMNVPHFATYWVAYEGFLTTLRGKASRNREEEMTVDYMAAGFVAGACAAVVSFPFDTVKTNLQLGYGRGFQHTLSGLVARRGVRGVFAGVIPRVMYTAPSGAIMMVTYETTKSALAFKGAL
ncbi:mitochondrial carrier protein-like protein [Leptomonas seymouri]|uniref:Mitochondrial carrier protein-like protein n=1 Tax=Leptomonas seymouri TaxID=5684 RepID=A0A0N1I6I9_LEPSE|nr:mitochondrial carrier protein-like protein [Leptomonas seymouri]|eukprot:KPI87731.1 mitochondrial carrier protein-like protein [Leptomonas seymouri]